MNMVAFDRLSMNMVAHERRSTEDQLGPQLFDHLSRNIVALDRLSMDVVALEARLAQLEKRNADLAKSIEERLELLHEQVKALAGLRKTATPEGPAAGTETDWDWRARQSCRSGSHAVPEKDKTAYIIGLFGTGRRYINELMLEHIGERAKYFRDTIRLHPGPTPMIYSGHATIKHVSRAQESPEVMARILEAAGSGFATPIFIYRHPLDSLLTNWIWWRTYIRENRLISGISQVYKNTDDLCADLERNFPEFEAFAKGDPDFFAALPGPPFLSFPQFVEETELHFQSATLALRLEDFMADAVREFCKIAEVMSVDLKSPGRSIARPKSKPYGHFAVKEKVPRFRDFVAGWMPGQRDG